MATKNRTPSEDTLTPPQELIRNNKRLITLGEAWYEMQPFLTTARTAAEIAMWTKSNGSGSYLVNMTQLLSYAFDPPKTWWSLLPAVSDVYSYVASRMKFERADLLIRFSQQEFNRRDALANALFVKSLTQKNPRKYPPGTSKERRR